MLRKNLLEKHGGSGKHAKEIGTRFPVDINEKINMAPENGPLQKEFFVHVSFRGCSSWIFQDIPGGLV